MKKLFLLTAVAVSFSMGLGSCSKCQVCTKDSSPELRICEDDYDNKSEYGAAVDIAEYGGYECKSSL